MKLQYLSLALIFILSACATEDMLQKPSAFNPEENRPGSWIDGALAGWTVLLKSSDEPRSQSKYPAIDGVCKVTTKPNIEEKPCAKTYVLFRHKDDETKVWVDENGHFRFPIEWNETYTAQAVAEGFKSNVLTIKQPEHIVLTIQGLFR